MPQLCAGLPERSELVEWVAQRRDLYLGRTVMDTAELVRFHYEDGPAGRLMRPQVLAIARTGLENGFADMEG